MGYYKGHRRKLKLLDKLRGWHWQGNDKIRNWCGHKIEEKTR